MSVGAAGGKLDPQAAMEATREAAMARVALQAFEKIIAPQLDGYDREAQFKQAQGELTPDYALQWAAKRLALLRIRSDLEEIVSQEPHPGG